MKRLDGKVCVVTGGASGIGHASVLRFLSEGAKVVLADVNADAGQEKVASIAARGDGQRVSFFHCDVSEEVQVMRMIRFTVTEFGCIDCIFNNAGVGGACGRMIDTRVEDWDRTLALLLGGTFLCVKHAAKAMIQQNTGGSIVNNAALAALFGDVAGAAYSAAKAGIVSLTKTAAIELADNRIRVNAVCPGAIFTPLMVRGGDGAEDFRELVKKHQAWPEVGAPEHVAAVAAFLSSDDARFITGENIVVDGGNAAGGPGLYCSKQPLGELIAERLQSAGVRRFDVGSTGWEQG